MATRKYNTYTDGKKVIVTTRYAGKTIRAVAKCNPVDKFDMERGESLARARCLKKLADKRLKRAVEKYRNAVHAFEAAQKNMTTAAIVMKLCSAELKTAETILKAREESLA